MSNLGDPGGRLEREREIQTVRILNKISHSFVNNCDWNHKPQVKTMGIKKNNKPELIPYLMGTISVTRFTLLEVSWLVLWTKVAGRWPVEDEVDRICNKLFWRIMRYIQKMFYHHVKISTSVPNHQYETETWNAILRKYPYETENVTKSIYEENTVNLMIQKTNTLHWIEY